MSPTPLRYEKHGAIAVITFDRPAARHALSPEMICRLADAVIDFAADDALRVAVLTGSGDVAFCAGGDLQRSIPLMSGERPPEDDWDRRLLEDPQVHAASAFRGYPLDKPVIGAVNGACMAAGLEILLGTDIRLAAEHATFALPEVRRGVIPFGGSMARLPRQVPLARAMEIMLTGATFGAEEALRWGILNQVVPKERLQAEAMALAARIADNAPLAVQAVKRTVLASSGRPLDEAFRLEDEAKRFIMTTDDAREGPRAFMEKRPPKFSGR
ncbi:enoyl-CoA hydratase/isomerase family protein [Aquabacterium sp. J223]|uniref:enoyl-CoA hydratase/isomerase family protein n=1 Tax=Aquabacterium sp. J223 TaxID=2898431 RepID=UPI0021ADFE96|nr:enoyl-CoA hydratase-related protein [Aquabacterium sp. J223]UUX94370.1 enoyl-CoA hydratase-related protein [Aquabacterium sp. J223]